MGAAPERWSNKGRSAGAVRKFLPERGVLTYFLAGALIQLKNSKNLRRIGWIYTCVSKR